MGLNPKSPGIDRLEKSPGHSAYQDQGQCDPAMVSIPRASDYLVTARVFTHFYLTLLSGWHFVGNVHPSVRQQ